MNGRQVWESLMSLYQYTRDHKAIPLAALVVGVLGAYFGYEQVQLARQQQHTSDLHSVPQSGASDASTQSQPPAPVATQQAAPAPLRQRDVFRKQLKVFLSQSSEVFERFAGGTHRDTDRAMTSEVSDWEGNTAVWICSNMGQSALDHFMHPGEVPLGTGLMAVLGGTKLWTAFMMRRDRLQELIDRDTWDPDGPPVIRHAGCVR